MSETLDVKRACNDLLHEARTVQLATISDGGKPLASYAPFYRDEAGDFYVYTSQLSAHTANMLSNPTVSAMVITDEQSVEQIFARTRLVLECDVKAMRPDDQNHGSKLDAYQARHGKTVELLRSLPDFILFRLTPVSGTVVLGFGQAYRIENALLEDFYHIKSA